MLCNIYYYYYCAFVSMWLNIQIYLHLIIIFFLFKHPRLLPPCNMERPRFTISNVEQPRFLPPNNVPFSQPNLISNEFTVNRLDLNVVKNCHIPRLSPPPLPPFIGPIQSTSGMPRVSSSSTSAPFSNSSMFLFSFSTPLILYLLTHFSFFHYLFISDYFFLCEFYENSHP